MDCGGCVDAGVCCIPNGTGQAATCATTLGGC
jgi:hypothetical protein